MRRRRGTRRAARPRRGRSGPDSRTDGCAEGSERRARGGDDQNQIDEEDRPPVTHREQHPCEERADRSRERQRAHDQAEAAPEGTRRRNLAQQRESVRKDERTGDCLLDPEHDQQRQVRCEARAERGDGEPGEPAEHERPSSEPVTEVARDGLQRRHRDQVPGDEPTDRAEARVKVVDQLRQRDRDHRRVERDEHRPEHDCEDDADVAARPSARRRRQRAARVMARHCSR
jgi:hypothetical protein